MIEAGQDIAQGNFSAAANVTIRAQQQLVQTVNETFVNYTSTLNVTVPGFYEAINVSLSTDPLTALTALLSQNSVRAQLFSLSMGINACNE